MVPWRGLRTAECTAEGECPEDEHCDTDVNECFACVTDDHCGDEAPYCVSHECVECRDYEDDNCPSDQPVCRDGECDYPGGV